MPFTVFSLSLSPSPRTLPLLLSPFFPPSDIAEPNPPTGLTIDVDGLDLVVTWDEPFSLVGEDLCYIITIMNRGNVLQEEVTVNTTRFVLSELIGERDCAEYVFTVFSRNGFSKSLSAVTGRANIPTGRIKINELSLSLFLTLSLSLSLSLTLSLSHSLTLTYLSLPQPLSSLVPLRISSCTCIQRMRYTYYYA